jgi:hypothetical protein
VYWMPYLKKDAPPEVVEAIGQIEKRADDCFLPIKLLTLHLNVAVWSLLVGGIKRVEAEIKLRGDNTSHLQFTLLNLSRFIPVAMKWVMEHGKPPSTLASRRWTTSLASKVDEALSLAHQYSGFLTCFPMWHKNRYAAELISPTVVRFTLPGSPKNRQVSAYQKGLRPTEGDYKGPRAAKPEQTPRVRELFAQVFNVCRKAGVFRFEYDDPWDLWIELLPEYQARVDAIVRRSDSLSLGEYTISDFKRFYAALLAVSAAHEFLCFAWEKNYALYPLDSAVLIRSRSSWTAALSKLSGIPQEKCQTVLKDLTFDFTRSLDLHVHPVVPLDTAMTSLAIAPQFPLHSRPDECILRVCSLLRPAAFDITSLEKESEILAALQSIGTPYSLQGPISLPKPNPDIDLVGTDENSSTIVIAELKWIRKAIRPVELIDRDADVLKGIAQLKQIRGFLTQNPHYLSSRGKLPRKMNEYTHVYYILVARDHWPWVEPEDDISIVEFEAFSASLRRSEDLHLALNDLLKYEWLPVEGRDFIIRLDKATAGGVSIESEVFYST